MRALAVLRAAVLAAILVPSCVKHPPADPAFDFNTLKTGTLSGRLVVQWLEPDLFLFIPDSHAPLTFTRSTGEKITPGRLLTDGGSIPRPIWILRNYSPWGFAPAFIVHDWIFSMKHCKAEGYQHLSLTEAGVVMAEIMKTMIVLKKIDASPMAVASMYYAVVSPAALSAWNDGKCNPPPVGMFSSNLIQQYELSF